MIAQARPYVVAQLRCCVRQPRRSNEVVDSDSDGDSDGDSDQI